MHIGFIGLGDQGGPMARALLETDNALTVWARRPEGAAAICAAGAEWSDTPALLAARADLVALCVTDETAIRDILFDHALLENMRPGAILAIHSTIAPEAVTQLCELCEGRNVPLLDAPVSGSGLAVANRSLLLLIGGEEGAAAQLSDAYGSFCNPIIYLGPTAGCAARLKLLNNLKCAVDYALADQAMIMAAQQGLCPDLTRSAMLAGTGRSFALGAMERIVHQGRADHVAAILAKDVELALATFGDDVPESWSMLAKQGLAALRRRARRDGAKR